MKVISRVKLLAEKYGGKWKFRHHCEWWCDDNNRLVARVAIFSTDYDDEYVPSQFYMYYLDGSKPTERVF